LRGSVFFNDIGAQLCVAQPDIETTTVVLGRCVQDNGVLRDRCITQFEIEAATILGCTVGADRVLVDDGVAKGKEVDATARIGCVVGDGIHADGGIARFHKETPATIVCVCAVGLVGVDQIL
jgi:hypothetical protein